MAKIEAWKETGCGRRPKLLNTNHIVRRILRFQKSLIRSEFALRKYTAAVARISFGDVLRRQQVQPQLQYYAGASQQLLHIMHIIWARSYDKWKALSTIVNVVSTAWPES